ncbi:MAG: tRNA preQ1(34) S-adenosylmethionine ribosyltransferase-isomerase QueA [Chitinispirillales bacterium]|jgi:S-adenosylmethionine:tRNA ribosyltransferase-isomerase|nr:tRNA preQ1(34) S-adenosylmethionine ribosyltransferase-isomerase QueA [Chitinispirillales bacterium]
MKTNDFFYELPNDLIAKRPLEKRDDAKLMCINRKSEEIYHKKFYEIVDFLQKDDILVFNDTKVLQCRLFAIKQDTKAKVEFLFVKIFDNFSAQIIAKPAKRLKTGCKLFLEKNENVIFEIIENAEDGAKIVRFTENIFEILDEYGEIPLPPYMNRRADNQDNSDYQTIYAKELGALAAPTAGLHFTEELLENIRKKGVKLHFLTLKVGIGTFRPVKTDNPLEHNMHSEEYFIAQDTADTLNDALLHKNRIIAVGTTVVRALESAFDGKKIKSGHNSTKIMILSPYKFGVISGLITNFHLPQSTLIMLVSAFYDREKVLNAYQIAVSRNYRFFSYGDAMFLE